MTTVRLLLFAGALQLVGCTAGAYAQCVTFEKPEDLFARADVVFVGTVLETEATAAKGEYAIVEIATLRVEKTWNGRLTRHVRVGPDRSFEIDKD